MNKYYNLFEVLINLNEDDRNVIMSNLSKKHINMLYEIQLSSSAAKGALIGGALGALGSGASWAAKRLMLRKKLKWCDSLSSSTEVDKCKKRVKEEISKLNKNSISNAIIATAGGTGIGGAVGYITNRDKQSAKNQTQRSSETPKPTAKPSTTTPEPKNTTTKRETNSTTTQNSQTSKSGSTGNLMLDTIIGATLATQNSGASRKVLDVDLVGMFKNYHTIPLNWTNHEVYKLHRAQITKMLSNSFFPIYRGAVAKSKALRELASEPKSSRSEVSALNTKFDSELNSLKNKYDTLLNILRKNNNQAGSIISQHKNHIIRIRVEHAGKMRDILHS